MNADGLIRVGFLLFPGFPMACLTSVIEPLRAANEISGTRTFEWRLLAETGQRPVSSAEVAFDANERLEEGGDYDYLLLLSAPGAAFADPRTPAHLRRIERHGTTLGAISGGVFPLVRSGIAHTAPLSVHWCYEAAFAAEFPGVPRSDRVIEIAPRRVTASGAAAAFDLALHMIGESLGDAVATEVACWFQHPMMRKSGVQQAVPTIGTDHAQADLPPIVARAIAIAARDLSEPVAVADIARDLDVTPRHLERLFKAATGQNPSHYLRGMRMKAARQIVMYSNDRIADVAAAVGYGSVKSLVRHYRAAFGLTPQEDRARINLYRVEGNLPVPSV
ncbi:GlxA family transcriptional regulator [Roseivivax sediminis]|uniref:Transcriptional regulator GlxA family, contains an amidase domain and an AraC-type DNA-binding HTH domain n=1 Tax=Roseivivax sediminis TaxID=936889 RepID=A0A1I1WGW1_9RHOB|nr:helix-turn-helix domain-containing protein [Roseivivax sediminis]SFD92653.1 Transcriptional regulator GlxA family, contains an amidase domain and an AraC-type DNA-binding HTH domain [Roseivivax sediminis]